NQPESWQMVTYSRDGELLVRPCVDHDLLGVDVSTDEPPVRGESGEVWMKLPPRRREEPLPGPDVVDLAGPTMGQIARACGAIGPIRSAGEVGNRFILTVSVHHPTLVIHALSFQGYHRPQTLGQVVRPEAKGPRVFEGRRHPLRPPRLGVPKMEGERVQCHGG